MDLGTALAAVVAASAILVALRASRNASEVIGGLFQAPHLSWPAGVQEDDDASWSWARAAAGGEAPDPDPGATHPVALDRLLPGRPRPRGR
jgi:hypothetical protein